MKFRQTPSDFTVEELTTLSPSQSGKYSIYSLEKTDISTLDAINAICNCWKIPFRHISFGGLKDRHAVTSQFFSILSGPVRNELGKKWKVKFIGKTDIPFTSENISSNRFHIVLRDLNETEEVQFQNNFHEATQFGVPNYFDDQRFGSVPGPNQTWIAKLLIAGDFESALKQSMTQYYSHDSRRTKNLKNLIIEYWGSWKRIYPHISDRQARNALQILIRSPENFRGAALAWELYWNGLQLSAYQSFLWNKTLALWIQKNTKSSNLYNLPLRCGEYPVTLSSTKDYFRLIQSLKIPFATARWKPNSDDPFLPLIQEVLSQEVIRLEDLKIKKARTPFFSKGHREGFFWPQQHECVSKTDLLNPGKKCLAIKFTLPRGCYATMVVKVMCRQRVCQPENPSAC